MERNKIGALWAIWQRSAQFSKDKTEIEVSEDILSVLKELVAAWVDLKTFHGELEYLVAREQVLTECNIPLRDWHKFSIIEGGRNVQ